MQSLPSPCQANHTDEIECLPRNSR
jgi:hypothetical protein